MPQGHFRWCRLTLEAAAAGPAGLLPRRSCSQPACCGCGPALPRRPRASQRHLWPRTARLAAASGHLPRRGDNCAAAPRGAPVVAAVAAAAGAAARLQCDVDGLRLRACSGRLRALAATAAALAGSGCSLQRRRRCCGAAAAAAAALLLLLLLPRLLLARRLLRRLPRAAPRRGGPVRSRTIRGRPAVASAGARQAWQRRRGARRPRGL